MIERPIIAQFGGSDTEMLVYSNYQSVYVAFVYSFINLQISQTYHSDAGPSYVETISRFSQTGMAIFGKKNTAITDMTLF